MERAAGPWPIAAAMLPFPAAVAGRPVQEAPAELWRETFQDVVDAGFVDVDLTDSWVRPGDLSASRRTELLAVLHDAGLGVQAISAIRRSVIDPRDAAGNLAYSHRTIDAAAAMGLPVVSVGLHRPLTSAQAAVLWFWTVNGAKDPVDDPATWNLAVTRLRELGRHGAEVGVALSLEMYEDTYLGTADSAVRLLADIDHPNVGLNPDLGNLVRVQRPVERWEDMVTKTMPHANYWHVKNYLRCEDPRSGVVLTAPVPLELGVINYRSAVRDALAVGFRGAFCVEHYGGDSLGVCATNLKYLRTLLPSGGVRR